jgi:putative integration host factor subunit alpha
MDNNNNVNNDAVAARRRALAEALRTGEPVVVTATGEVEKKEDAEDQGMSGIQVPDGKLA